MSGSYYNLYSLYMALQAQLNAINAGGGVPTSSTLADVLLNGNSAGATDLDMNFNDILNCDNLQTNTINGAPVPSGVANTLQEVLTANNITDLTAEFRDNLSVPTITNTLSHLGMSSDNDLTLVSTTGDINLDTPNGVVNFNGVPYPLSYTLSEVLTAGNSATNSITLNNTGTGTNVINLLPNASSNNPNITLTDGTTTNTIDKNGYTTRNTTANLPHYLNFSDNSSTGTGAIQKTAGISCNPNTNTITATNFAGTATNATNVDITKKTDNVEYPLVFTTTGTGNKAVYTGTGSTLDNPIYNPTLNTLTVKTSNGSYCRLNNGAFDVLSTGNNATNTMNGIRISATDTSTSNTCSLEKTGQVKTSVNNNTYPATSNSSNLYLINRSATAGATSGVPSIVFDAKTGRNTVAGDVIGSQNYFALNYAGAFTEFARVEASVRNTGVGNDDGSIGFSGLVNGVQTEFFRVNGADSENNCFLPLDMNGQAIKSSSGNLAFSSTGSSGGGVINLTSKTQSPTSQPDFIITNNVTNTLTHSVSAGWDFQANNLTTSGNITCNTLNYTTLNPPIANNSGITGVVVVNASVVLTGTTPYGKCYYHDGTASDYSITLPSAGTQTGGVITFSVNKAPTNYGFNFTGGVNPPVTDLKQYPALNVNISTIDVKYNGTYSYRFYDAGAVIGWLVV